MSQQPQAQTSSAVAGLFNFVFCIDLPSEDSDLHWCPSEACNLDNAAVLFIFRHQYPLISAACHGFTGGNRNAAGRPHQRLSVRVLAASMAQLRMSYGARGLAPPCHPSFILQTRRMPAKGKLTCKRQRWRCCAVRGCCVVASEINGARTHHCFKTAAV